MSAGMFVRSQGREDGRKQHTHPPSLHLFLSTVYVVCGTTNCNWTVYKQALILHSLRGSYVFMHLAYSTLCCRNHNTVSTFKKVVVYSGHWTKFICRCVSRVLVATAHLSRSSESVIPTKEGRGVLPHLSWPNFIWCGHWNGCLSILPPPPCFEQSAMGTLYM